MKKTIFQGLDNISDSIFAGIVLICCVFGKLSYIWFWLIIIFIIIPSPKNDK